MTTRDYIKQLLDKADRCEASVSSQAGPSSQEWVSPERFDAYLRKADKIRAEAKKLAEAAEQHGTMDHEHTEGA